MSDRRSTLALAKVAGIAKTGSAARWGKYEVLVGEHKQFRDSPVWTVEFPERGKDGVSILVADRRFKVYLEFADFRVLEGQAFVTTDDIDGIGVDGSGPLALKISVSRDAVRLPSVPLHHVVGMEIPESETASIRRRMVDLTNFGIPLRILSYDLPFSPDESLAHAVAEHTGKPASSIDREETIRLEASGNPRVLFAYGQSLYLDEHDLSNGLMAVVPPQTETVLHISRRPRMNGEAFYPSSGVVMVLEDLESNTLPPAP